MVIVCSHRMKMLVGTFVSREDEDLLGVGGFRPLCFVGSRPHVLQVRVRPRCRALLRADVLNLSQQLLSAWPMPEPRCGLATAQLTPSSAPRLSEERRRGQAPSHFSKEEPQERARPFPCAFPGPPSARRAGRPGLSVSSVF